MLQENENDPFQIHELSCFRERASLIGCPLLVKDIQLNQFTLTKFDAGYLHALTTLNYHNLLQIFDMLSMFVVDVAINVHRNYNNPKLRIMYRRTPLLKVAALFRTPSNSPPLLSFLTFV